MLGSRVTTLIISNEEMEYIMKVVKYLEDFGLLIKGITQTVKTEAGEQGGGLLDMLLSTLGAILLGNMLVGKGMTTMSKGRGFIQAGDEVN